MEEWLDEWLKKVEFDINNIKSRVKTFDDLVKKMESKKYIISYPETFKKIYWNVKDE